MEPVVNVIIILGACGIFVLTVICCVSHRKKEPLSQPRDLEKGLAGIKDARTCCFDRNSCCRCGCNHSTFWRLRRWRRWWRL
ncbi:hypothetical protein ARALYDRAFT_920885 [Arabidopsis lyrata subsp. lyrata]|uniref:Transmembrane protein n=1 Tax=Arabidopsis lyrata subsp. lyrata TaxID=81972 RepID=D7MXZ1_ARALL|nr:hypothetical protein ARALYDRAFT_920885 [Arabidopsis lyrata subsp. lyrata]